MSTMTTLVNAFVGVAVFALIWRLFRTARQAEEFWRPNYLEIPKHRLDAVVGLEEVKTQTRPILAYLRGDRTTFSRLGARPPRGILLVGPTGVGKTHLAQAIAGEAGLPFFYISATELIEIFVGVGASRVRLLFEAALATRPCVVFIDDIDLLGRIRGGATLYDNAEREQTLNALLAALDGFERSDDLLVLAAARDYPLLDSALSRPGRFDRVLHLKNPQTAGEVGEMLDLLAPVNQRSPELTRGALDTLAGRLVGRSRADIAQIVQDARWYAVRRDHRELTGSDLELAVRGRVGDAGQALQQFLTESAGMVGAPFRPLISLRLHAGENIYGYVQWNTDQYIKLIGPHHPDGIILAKSAIYHLQPMFDTIREEQAP